MQPLTKLVPVHLTAEQLDALARLQARHQTANRSDTIRRIIELADIASLFDVEPPKGKPRKTKGKPPISEKSGNP